MSAIEYINLSNEINAIVYKDGQTAKGADEYEERRKEANQIWQFTNFYNGNGAVIPDEEIRVGKDYKAYAEIRIAKGGNGLWAMVTTYMLPNQGASSPICVFERIGFMSRDDAILAGILELQNALKKITEREYEYKSDRKMADHLFRLLEEQKKPQLDLF